LPLVAATIILGVYPMPLFKACATSITALLEQNAADLGSYHTSKLAAAAALPR
jgi:NADH:ubiquinone oxidoreductase subunit 4 (subunit M)